MSRSRGLLSWSDGPVRLPTGKSKPSLGRRSEQRFSRNLSSGVRVVLHPEARIELRAAALWYEERRAGLGDEFLSETSTVLTRIGTAAESYPR